MAASFCRTHLVSSVFRTVRVQTPVVWTFIPVGARAIGVSAVAWRRFTVNFTWLQESAQRNLVQKRRFLAAGRFGVSCHPAVQRPCSAGGAAGTGSAAEVPAAVETAVAPEAAIAAETMETAVVLETADAVKDADVAEASVDAKTTVASEASEASLAAEPVITMETVNAQDVASTSAGNDPCGLGLGGFEPTSYTSALEHLLQQSEVMPPSEAGVLSLDSLVKTLRQENGCDICVIRIPPSLCYADHMVIVTASSQRHLVALAEYVHKLYKSIKSPSDPHVLLEGKTSDNWMCIDFGTTVLHIMLDKTRKRYEIEKLWTLREMDDQLELLQPEFLPDDLILEGHDMEHHWGVEVPPDENKL